MTSPTPTPLPCAACKQPVIEKRTLDGALVVLDAATKRVHLCVKRKEVEAAKAKQVAASREKAKARPAPRPPVKRAAVVAPPPTPARPVKKQRPRRTTLRSPEQVTEMLKKPIVRWRTGDGPTSFCDTCGAPVLVGFSHVRWDVIMVDAVGHRAHDCEASRKAAAELRAQPAVRVDIPELPAAATSARAVRTLAPVVPAAPVATAEAKPRRRPAREGSVTADNSCEACGNLKALVNGKWVCLHCA